MSGVVPILTGVKSQQRRVDTKLAAANRSSTALRTAPYSPGGIASRKTIALPRTIITRAISPASMNASREIRPHG